MRNVPDSVSVVIASPNEIPHVIPSDSGLPSVSVVGITRVKEASGPKSTKLLEVMRLYDATG